MRSASISPLFNHVIAAGGQEAMNVSVCVRVCVYVLLLSYVCVCGCAE